jgi:hypothetical protein
MLGRCGGIGCGALIAFWIGPSIIGLPLVARALHRHTHPIADIRATFRAATTAFVIAGAG